LKRPNKLTELDIFSIAVEHFLQPDASVAGFDFMIRYTIRLTDPNVPTKLVSPVEKQYRELLELREQVEKAEAAARRLGPRGKLKTFARPLVRLVSRQPIKRRSGEFTKGQLYAMLAEAVRNTH
jgi:hypothetical protein